MTDFLLERDIKRYASKMNVEEFENKYLESQLSRVKVQFEQTYDNMKEKLPKDKLNELVNVFSRRIDESYKKGEEYIRKFSKEKIDAATQGLASPDSEENIKKAINNLHIAADRIKKELEQYKH